MEQAKAGSTDAFQSDHITRPRNPRTGKPTCRRFLNVNNEQGGGSGSGDNNNPSGSDSDLGNPTCPRIESVQEIDQHIQLMQ